MSEWCAQLHCVTRTPLRPSVPASVFVLVQNGGLSLMSFSATTDKSTIFRISKFPRAKRRENPWRARPAFG